MKEGGQQHSLLVALLPLSLPLRSSELSLLMQATHPRGKPIKGSGSRARSSFVPIWTRAAPSVIREKPALTLMVPVFDLLNVGGLGAMNLPGTFLTPSVALLADKDDEAEGPLAGGGGTVLGEKICLSQTVHQLSMNSSESSNILRPTRRKNGEGKERRKGGREGAEKSWFEEREREG